MYIPKQFLMEDEDEAIAFMQKYSFAIIVTAADNVPQASHLPFLVEQRDDKLLLSSHFAKANPQSLLIKDVDILVIFTEPHAYISPTSYEKKTNVPTWNYLAVHAYGRARILETEDEHRDLLERTINNYEEAYLNQWLSLPEEYKHRMINSITGFEVTVTDLQGKKKLSQNKTDQERRNIIKRLKESSDNNSNEIAGNMSKTGLKRS